MWLKDPDKIYSINKVQSVLDIPLTVKMRTVGRTSSLAVENALAEAVRVSLPLPCMDGLGSKCIRAMRTLRPFYKVAQALD